MNVKRFTQKIPGSLDLLSLHEFRPERYPYLLESVAKGTTNSRYDILFAFPGSSLVLNDFLGHQGSVPMRLRGSDFLENLDFWMQLEPKIEGDIPDLPFHGGWFVYLAYELAAQVEPTLKLPALPRSLPVAFATRCPAAVIQDHDEQCLYLVAEGDEDFRLQAMLDDIELVRQYVATQMRPIEIRQLQEENPQRYVDAVHKVHDFIVAGDIFQANVSRLWQAQLNGKYRASDLYRRLRVSNPAPFAGLACWQEASIISSSPERLLRVKNGVAETRPIAGTRPRLRDAAGEFSDQYDKAMTQELIGHPKERAEHVMLIDLERNDLGRVCQPGTVKVDEFMVLESYAHVHHIVSNVRGQLREEVSTGEAIRAVFPGGTITGCPKVRCMEIIAELEQRPREAYTGSMGYINLNGDMDLNILIRTLIQDGDQVQFRAGAGLVVDSIAEKEVEETLAKARGMLMALSSQEKA